MILHTFQSAKTQGNDNSIVGPTAWNQDHTLQFPIQVYSAIGGTLLFQIWGSADANPNGIITGNTGDLFCSQYAPYSTNHGGLWFQTGVTGNVGWIQIGSGGGGGGGTPTGNAGGDVTGTYPASLVVSSIHGVLLSGLATGLLKNTTGTGVPSIAASSDVVTALGYTPLSAANNLSDLANAATARSNLSVFLATQAVAISANSLTYSSGYGGYLTTLNSNVVTFTLANGTVDGQLITMQFLHDATTTLYTIATPANLRGLFQPGSVANKYNCQSFRWNSSASLWLATDMGVVNI